MQFKILSFAIFLHLTLLCNWGINSQQLFSKAKLNKKCKRIGPTKNLDMEWAMSIFAGKTFLLTMGSTSAFTDLTEALQGKKATTPEEINNMCATVSIKGFKSTIEGYDNHFLVIDCAMIKKGMQECRAGAKTEFPDRHKAVHAIQTLAWTDNKESILLIRCTPDGLKNDWLLYSANATISDATKEKVRFYIKKLGFPEDEIHNSSYDSCPTALQYLAEANKE